MNRTDAGLERLKFLRRVVQKEATYLQIKDHGLFSKPFTEERAGGLDSDIEFAERVEAFVGRFGRLQDTLADKLLPALLSALGEQVSAAIDNLDRAERLGWIASTAERLTLRRLKNQMVHEYLEDLAVLANALNNGHQFMPTLLWATERSQSTTEHYLQRCYRK